MNCQIRLEVKTDSVRVANKPQMSVKYYKRAIMVGQE